MIRVLVDTAADYTMEEIREKNLECVPMHITINGKDYRDCYDLSKKQFYELMLENGGFPTTSQPSPQDFVDVFEAAKEAGEDVICILLSSKLSGTCQSAVLAQNIVDYDRIYLVDSLAATYMNRILADFAVKRVAEGAAAELIVSELEKLKSRIRIFAVVDTLEYLYKGGRLSKAAAVIGEMARIKPMITVSEGEVSVTGKCLGKNKAISALLKNVQEREIDTEFPVYSLYTYGTDNCEILEERLRTSGCELTERLQLGATIGTHIGPGAFGLLFVEK